MPKTNNPRRDFLKKLSLTTIGMAGLPALSLAAQKTAAKLEIPEGLTVLFQGDSITDASRDRGQYYANQAKGLGVGYVYQIVSQLLGTHPTKNIRCYNRGISGHKVFQLAGRWNDDCLNLKPDVLSILIGVNDFWHTLSWGYEGTVEVYDTDLRKLLDRTMKELPDVKLIIGEPFAVAGGSAINEKWETFAGYRESAAKIAKDYKAAFIPYQSIFDEALEIAPVSYWCPDGVHPSIAGGHLMAVAWLEAFKEIME